MLEDSEVLRNAGTTIITGVLSVAVKTTPINNLVGRAYAILHLFLRGVIVEAQCRNLEARTEAGTMVEHCLLTCSQWFDYPVSSLTRTTWLRVGITHRSLSPPALISNFLMEVSSSVAISSWFVSNRPKLISTICNLPLCCTIHSLSIIKLNPS